MSINLLLLSSSRAGSSGYLEDSKPLIKEFLGEPIRQVIFIPYAGVNIYYGAYEKLVASHFNEVGYQLRSLHEFKDLKKAVKETDAFVVGGGNTFHLLYQLYRKELVDLIKEKVLAGTPYIGWSAGSNIAAPTIKTTNDMPIIQPQSFDALNLIPFQLNPHYLEAAPPQHHGETRDQRIEEFLKINQKSQVVALPEGVALWRKDQQLSVVGHKEAFLFYYQEGNKKVAINGDISNLLQQNPSSP